MASVIFPLLGRQRPPEAHDYRWTWEQHDVLGWVCPVIAKGNIFEGIEAKA